MQIACELLLNVILFNFRGILVSFRLLTSRRVELSVCTKFVQAYAYIITT